MTFGRFSTLTVRGIPWNIFSFNGKTAYGIGAHAIVHHEGFYLLKEMGKVVFVGLSIVEALEAAHEYVWEYHANRLQPCWACPMHTASGQATPIQELQLEAS